MKCMIVIFKNTQWTDQSIQLCTTKLQEANLSHMVFVYVIQRDSQLIRTLFL